ncbi:hypothetical protein C8R45DRAFT_473837 [Mycena sanguinolenta]|nr:hypothetical protein C8R45DRAFT_473837 [Mycena sanguinolenta]
MSLFSLVGDGEYNLVNLLKAFLAHEPSAIAPLHSIYLFSHPAVEKEFASLMNEYVPRNFRAFGKLRILQRNYFIVQALISIIEAYAGEPAPKISVNEERERQRCPCGDNLSSQESPAVIHECVVCKVAWCSACSRARKRRCGAKCHERPEGRR